MNNVQVDIKGRNMPVTAFRFEVITGTGVVSYTDNMDGGVLVYLLSTATGQTFKFVAVDNTNQSTFVTLTDEKGFFPVLLSKIDWSATTQTIYRIK